MLQYSHFGYSLRPVAQLKNFLTDVRKVGPTRTKIRWRQHERRRG